MTGSASRTPAAKRKRGSTRPRASATLNHTIVWCSDPEKSAGFLTEVSLDYMAAESEPIAPYGDPKGL